jgi:hypothetical protein
VSGGGEWWFVPLPLPVPMPLLGMSTGMDKGRAEKKHCKLQIAKCKFQIGNLHFAICNFFAKTPGPMPETGASIGQGQGRYFAKTKVASS